MSIKRVKRSRALAFAAVWVAAVLGYVQGNTALAQQPADPAADSVCETLMADYILRRGKIESDDINAAILLIASRGRNGYWRTVFQHYQEDPDNRYLLAILTKMLGRDGNARWLLSHPEDLRRSAWAPRIVLSDDVLDAIMARAREVDRKHLDPLVVAVVAAHDRRTRDFLLDVLNGKVGAAGDSPVPPAGDAPERSLFDDASFHAAVGLANLGEPAGFQWLLGDHLEDTPDLQARLQALSDLTGLPNRSLEEWRAWWRENAPGDRFEPKSPARLRHRY